MSYIGSPIKIITECLNHSTQVFPHICFDDLSRPHLEEDIVLYAAFPQHVVVNNLLSEHYVVVLESMYNGYCVYFNDTFGFHIEDPNEQFFEDLEKRQLSTCKNVYSQ